MSLDELNVELPVREPGLLRLSCRRCPRLVEWRERVAREKRRAYLDTPEGQKIFRQSWYHLNNLGEATEQQNPSRLLK